MNRKSSSERDICSKYIAPAIQQAGWDMHTQVHEKVSFTMGLIIARGKQHSRGESRRTDFILYPQCGQLKTQLTQARQLNEQLFSNLVKQAVA